MSKAKTKSKTTSSILVEFRELGSYGEATKKFFQDRRAAEKTAEKWVGDDNCRRATLSVFSKNGSIANTFTYGPQQMTEFVWTNDA